MTTQEIRDGVLRKIVCKVAPIQERLDAHGQPEFEVDWDTTLHFVGGKKAASWGRYIGPDRAHAEKVAAEMRESRWP